MARRRTGVGSIKDLHNEADLVDRAAKLLEEAGYKPTALALSSLAPAFDFLVTTPRGKRVAIECKARAFVREADLERWVTRGRGVRPALSALWIVSDDIAERLRNAAKAYPEVELWTWYEFERQMRWERERRRNTGKQVRGQPPAPNPDAVSGPKVVAAQDESELGKKVRELGLEAKALRDRIARSGEEYERPPLDSFFPPPWKRSEVFRTLGVLIAAFEDVEGYDPRRHHNQPPPALWINDRGFRSDLSALLHELRELNSLLRKLAERDGPVPKPIQKKAQVAIELAGAGTKKFVESYCDMLGKGTAALTIGAAAMFLASVGLPKELVDTIWGHLRPGK
ncbi:MAG: hypothetical protein KIS73_06280 [Enhydrobacter sp.]|nr:hypothetical protein [Enhydrobacter sp.]